MSDYKNIYPNLKSSDKEKIKNIKISSMTFYNDDIYFAETYLNVLNIYKLIIKRKHNFIEKKLFRQYVFDKKEKIEGFAMNDKYFYLGIDTDFEPYLYNMIRINYMI